MGRDLQMMNGIAHVDLEAFEAFDARTLLCVLARAIDEEMAGRRRRGHAGARKEGERVEALRRLVGMIQAMLDRGVESGPPPGRAPGAQSP